MMNCKIDTAKKSHYFICLKMKYSDYTNNNMTMSRDAVVKTISLYFICLVMLQSDRNDFLTERYKELLQTNLELERELAPYKDVLEQYQKLKHDTVIR